MRKTTVGLVLVCVVAWSIGACWAAPKVETGIVKTSDATTALELTLPNKAKVTITPKGVTCPVGTYTPVSMTIMKLDKSGKVWSVAGAPKTFTVTKDETTTLDVPTGINATAMLYGIRKTPTQTYLDIGLSFKAETGEGFGHEVKLGAARVPAPAFQIVNEKGVALQTGNFEYG